MIRAFWPGPRDPERDYRTGRPLQRRCDNLEAPSRRRRRPDNPRGVGLTFEAIPIRRIEVSGSSIPLRPFPGPWGLPTDRRPRPSFPDLHASLPGLRPSSRVFTRGRLSRPLLAKPARHASRGVSRPSAHHGSAGPHTRGSHTPLRSVPRVSTLSTASSPRTLPTVFQAGALLGFRPPGV
jgi:hypothetical protein